MSVVTEDPEQDGARPPGAEAPAEDSPQPRPVRVGWVAGPRTLDRFARTLGPLAIGMLDELVHLTAICPEGIDTRQLPTPPIEIIPYSRRKWWMPTRKVAEPLAEKLSGGKLELLHALDADTAALTGHLARSLGICCVISCYSLRDARRLGKVGQQVAAVLAASRPILEQLRRRKVAPTERIRLLRPGVHRVRHANCFNDPQHSICIVMCGALDDFNAYGAALHSFAELTSRNYDCAFFIIGSGPAETRLRALSERLAVHHALTFADYQPGVQLPGIFKAADVYVAPVSRRDLDVHCLLAMAAGVPVLAASGGAGDFLHHGRTALLFKRGGQADLTMKLLGVVEDRAAARDLAESALRYLGENHSPAAMVFALADIYRQVAGSHPQPGHPQPPSRFHRDSG